jgi:VWFA-related protein
MTVNLFPQAEQHKIIITNIIVPVTVLDGNRFVDDLTIDDFELYEDGKLQKIQALYLTNKAKIIRTEADQDFMPLLSRNFYLFFQALEYNPKINEAIDYFFSNVMLPGDTLSVMTPVKNYSLSSQALQSKSKEVLAKELKGIIRKDIQIGASNYNSLLRDLKRLVRGISSAGGQRSISDVETGSSSSQFGIEFLLPRYKDTLSIMDNLRVVDEKKFLLFASRLKRLGSQKIVFFFYQREFRPEIHPSVLSRLTSMYQDDPNILGQVQDLFQMYNRAIKMNTERITQAFSDSSIQFNFIFMSKNQENISGVYMREQSEDVFDVFSEMANATGGTVDTSQNPAAGFINTAGKFESHYLLYYSPENYREDGQFKTIQLKVKDKNYKINHRIGYYAIK